MTSPALDYFAREAADCLARLRAWRAGGVTSADPTRAEDARAAARALRGAATMAAEPEFAALGAAFERAAAAAEDTDGVLGAALDQALAAGDQAAGAPRPLGAEAAGAVRTAASLLAAAADARGLPDGLPPRAPARVVPVRALARDGDTEFLVRRAPSPPTTADRRFRDASAPLARAVQRLVADARTATHDGPAAPGLIHTLGADLRAAVADLRELAEGYDVAPAVRFFGGREPGAGALDARTLAALAVATAGLLGETDSAPAAEEGSVPVDAAEGPLHAPDTLQALAPEGPPAADPPPERPDAAPAHAAPGPDEFRPATGDALVALLQTGISGLGAIGALDDPAASPAVGVLPPEAEPVPGGPVAIDTLLYRGPAAVARARAVRDLLRAQPGPPDPALLNELYDLLDLAAAG